MCLYELFLPVRPPFWLFEEGISLSIVIGHI